MGFTVVKLRWVGGEGGEGGGEGRGGEVEGRGYEFIQGILFKSSIDAFIRIFH